MTSWCRLPLRQWIRNEGETITEFPAKLAGAIRLLLAIHELPSSRLVPPTGHVFRLLFTGLSQLPPRPYPLEILSIGIA